MWFRAFRRPPTPQGSDTAPKVFAAKPEWGDHGAHGRQVAYGDFWSCGGISWWLQRRESKRQVHL